jgi:Na+-driven multidrug efflux pump
MAVQFSLVAVFRASGNMMTTMVLTLVSQWVLQFPLAYTLSKHTTLGADGLWWSFAITNVLAALATAVWYRRGTWKKTKLITSEDKLTEQVSEEIIVEEGVRG